MEFSFGNEATGLGQSQTFSLDSFIFPGSGGMQFDIEMKSTYLVFFHYFNHSFSVRC